MFPFRPALYLMLTFSGLRVNHMPLGRGFRLVGATGGHSCFSTDHANQHIIKADDASRKAGVFTVTWYKACSQAGLAEKLTAVR